MCYCVYCVYCTQIQKNYVMVDKYHNNNIVIFARYLNNPAVINRNLNLKS